MRITRKTTLGILACGLGVSTLLAAGSGAGAAGHGCEITWGSLPETATASSAPAPTLVDIRAGHHDCYDRLVIDFEGDITGYDVSYVDEVLSQGSGHLIPLDGGANLRVMTWGPAHDDDFTPTYDPADRAQAVNVSGYPTLRQVHFDASFEGESLIGVGVRARLPFRTFILDGPGDGSRLVIDVAHTW
jgi:hypothetical protein